MLNTIQDIYQIGKQMKQIYKKVDLLNRKQKLFGLTSEEEKRLRKYRTQSWLLHDELIETHLNISVMPYLITKEYEIALKEIREIIPWNGGIVRSDEDLEGISDRFLLLTEEEKEKLAIKLEFLHIHIMQQFELFCSSEEGYRYIQDVSKVITTEEDGNVLDVLVYLDTRYRDLANLLEIELQEVEVFWEDEEE